MTKTIQIQSCSDCPYLGLSRYYYCKKKFQDDSDAYRANEHAENQFELKFLFSLCPL